MDMQDAALLANQRNLKTIYIIVIGSLRSRGNEFVNRTGIDFNIDLKGDTVFSSVQVS